MYDKGHQDANPIKASQNTEHASCHGHYIIENSHDISFMPMHDAYFIRSMMSQYATRMHMLTNSLWLVLPKYVGFYLIVYYRSRKQKQDLLLCAIRVQAKRARSGHLYSDFINSTTSWAACFLESSNINRCPPFS